MSVVMRARRAAIDLGQRAQRIDPGSVYFNSFQGRYSDNPRAIAECLRSRDGREEVWRADPAHGEAFPTDVRTVAGGSWGHVRALGGAGHVITNDWMVSHPKRRGQVWVQTWHGTPLKKLALDRALRPDEVRSVRDESAKWDYLISPNPFSTELFRGAFGYEGAVLETGYPRNDVLSAPEADEIRARIRQELGITDDRTVVLYAPTWRDRVVEEGDPQGVGLPLDLTEIAAGLGESHTVLLRLHHFIAPSFADAEGPSCINVSMHPDIRELYLAADVLVTDYSSTMFDFAVTGKPVLFLAPDLEAYRDEMRGFYFDFEADAPGPIARTTAELLDQLADPGETQRRWGPAYDAFRKKFCGLEDGHASERVVDAVFGGAEG